MNSGSGGSNYDKLSEYEKLGGMGAAGYREFSFLSLGSSFTVGWFSA